METLRTGLKSKKHARFVVCVVKQEHIQVGYLYIGCLILKIKYTYIYCLEQHVCFHYEFRYKIWP